MRKKMWFLNFNILYKYIMKTLQEIKKDFMREAREYDTGKKQEDFHAYLRNHNLEHHLSQTQVQDRQRASNGLNAMSMVAGIAVPLTLGAVFGLQKLTSNIIGHGEFYDREPIIQRGGHPNTAPESLSGHNTRAMPTADNHIGLDTHSTLFPKGYHDLAEDTFNPMDMDDYL